MREISAFPGYFVDAEGGIYRLNGRSKGLYKLRPSKNGYGYAVVSLCLNHKKRMRYVHRLVAEAYLPNPENKPQVNHKNFERMDNRVENLEWCTVRENWEHLDAAGHYGRGENHARAHLTLRQVRAIKWLLSRGSALRECAVIFGVSNHVVHKIKVGKNWGYVKPFRCGKAARDAIQRARATGP